MSFPRRLLADHERLVFDLKPHWVALIPPVLWMVLGILIYAVGYRLADDNLDSPGLVQNIVGVVAVIVIVWRGLLPIARWTNTSFVLTSDRLITRSGVIAKQSKEIPLERINDVAFTQTMIERMLGAGDLMLESAGERGQTLISNVRHPETVQLTVYKEVEENNNRMVRSGGGADLRGESVTDQLEALGRLKEQGVISDMEFETKKQELLKRL